MTVLHGSVIQKQIVQINLNIKKMKNLFILSFAIFSSFAFSQVAIDKSETTSGASLEFGDNQGKGIVLPYVTTVAGTPAGYAQVNSSTNGTLILDLYDRKVKLRQNGGWFDLSNLASTTNTISTAVQDDKTESNIAKASIGTPTSTVGVLVLEDNNKAMILPREASPHLSIKNPAPGMIAWDTVKKQLCVYNGTQWSFWSGQ